MTTPTQPIGQRRTATLSAALDDLNDLRSSDADLEAAAEVISRVFETAPQASAAMMAARTPVCSPASSTLAAFGLVAAVVGGGRVLFAESPLGDAEISLSVLAGSVRSKRRSFGTLRLGRGRQAVAVAAAAGDTRSWPLPPEARAALEAGPGRTAIIAFVPSSSPDFAPTVARIFGLTPAESRLTTTLFTCETLEAAAASLTTSAETLRKHMRSILRKTGTPRRAALMSQIVEIVAGDYSRARDRSMLMREAFGMTPAEARTADAIARGRTIPEIALQFRISPHTVRTQADAALAKTGQKSAASLARIMSEVCALAVWTQASETRQLHQNQLLAATRILPAPGGRRIAVADYGPAGQPVILCFHQGMSYRWVKLRLREAFRARGFRVVSFDMPDCGQTDAAPGRPMFEAAADDAERLLATLKIERVRIFAPQGGTGPALTFAARRPDMVDEGVLLMPRSPQHELSLSGPLQRVVQAALRRPALANAFFETLRASSSSRLLHWIHTQTAMKLAVDRDATADPAFMEERQSEVLAAHSRSTAGMLALEQAYQSWTVPTPGGARWTVIETAAQMFRGRGTPQATWQGLPGVNFVRLDDAGRLATHTHANEIASLFTLPA